MDASWCGSCAWVCQRLQSWRVWANYTLAGQEPVAVVGLTLLTLLVALKAPRFLANLSWQGTKTQVLGIVFSLAQLLPFVAKQLNDAKASAQRSFEKSLNPEGPNRERNKALPAKGISQQKIVDGLAVWQKREEPKWNKGNVSGGIYHGGEDLTALLCKVYSMFSLTNPLHADLWPSLKKCESEIVAMTATMLGAYQSEANSQVCGTMSSGGTESIVLAIKSYRDWARDTKGITEPELVCPNTAHAAFDKACMILGVKLVSVGLDSEMKCDVRQARNAINSNTIALVGSAPNFPHGIIDDIAALSELARSRNIGFHTDCCLGGFVLPFARKLGYPLPPFDFSLPGVTSISADVHKYGYAPKGTSVILYRTPALRQYQYFVFTDWPGGVYATPTIAGSRPGGLSAGAWAAMMAMGEDGYKEATRAIFDTAHRIRDSIRDIPGLTVIGSPLAMVVAFGAKPGLDVYKVNDLMVHKGWSLNVLQRPNCIHLCVTLLHTRGDCADRFIADVKESFAVVVANPKAKDEHGSAPMYGMASSLPVRGPVKDLVSMFLDSFYTV